MMCKSAVLFAALLLIMSSGCDNGNGSGDTEEEIDIIGEDVDMEADMPPDVLPDDTDVQDIEEDDGGETCEIPGNILQNPGFENGDLLPSFWVSFPESLPGVTFGIDAAAASEGARSVFIESTAAEAQAMWRQVVTVEPGTVYVMTGQVKFEDVAPPGQCNLQIVFRNAADEVVKLIDYPSHTRTREFALDFPPKLKVRAPADAATAEVNMYLKGTGKAWFDDIFFAPAPAGTVAGTVTDGEDPLEGATITIWGNPWNRAYQATTDADGYYEITGVPEAYPRYILFARKDGYRTRPRGDVAITGCETTTVDFEIEEGVNPSDSLRVKFGDLAHVTPGLIPVIPEDALIPESTTGYHESVWPYLAPDDYIESSNPDIISLAEEILATVPEEDRDKVLSVARAVHGWVSEHIEHDGIFSYNAPPSPDRTASLNEDFTDVTSGIYQTITAEGWSWGKNFYDWAYKPTELIQVEGGICVEHSWLDSALLRALDIPARAAIGSNQFWVQPAEGMGFWAAMSTTAGRSGFRENGNIDQGIGGPEPHYFSVLSRPLLHEDWDWERPGLWREVHPYQEMYADTGDGLALALAHLGEFAVTGESAAAPPIEPPVEGYYLIHYSDITLNLFNIGDQRTLNVRFPFISESPSHNRTGNETYWTNHPECVVETRTEEITNPPAMGTEKWFIIQFDLTSLVDVE